MENVHVKHLFAILEIVEKLLHTEVPIKYTDVFMITCGNGWKVLPTIQYQQTFVALMLIVRDTIHHPILS